VRDEDLGSAGDEVVAAAIDRDRVTSWFEEHVPGARGPLDFELIAGGRSNLTFRVADAAGASFVLRRPPTSHVLPTAHDMSREHRIISALAGTPVPVPRAFGLCTDPEVNGQPFYVMEHVDGHVLRDAAIAEKVLDPSARHRAGLHMAEVLAHIHAVDVDAVGLGDLARREGYIDRQLKRWYGQFEQSAAQVDHSVPGVDAMHRWLSEHVPEQGPAAIVHGDYRLDNSIVGDDGTVLAVLDWEICTLGDPLADVGLLMVYWAEPGDESALGVAPTTAPGFPDRAAMRDRYAEVSGRDISDLDFYVAFGYWKLACILEGVYARYVAGATGGDRSSHEGFAVQVEKLAEASQAAAGA
jgi:aminoglycoside phosphotransferase (APT) family kinase protein